MGPKDTHYVIVLRDVHFQTLIGNLRALPVEELLLSIPLNEGDSNEGVCTFSKLYLADQFVAWDLKLLHLLFLGIS